MGLRINLTMEMNFTEEFNLTNFSSLAPEERNVSMLKSLTDGVFLAVLVIIMLSMGCDITIPQVLQHLKKPIGVICGMISQFLLMPLSAFGITQAFQFSAAYAVGVLIISCSPGGVLSNTFTYFCDGDLALSVTMTTASTIMALGFLPLNMWIYNTQMDSGSLVIPYGEIALSLIYVTSPTVVGMLIRWKAKKLAGFITKVGSYSGAGLIFLCIILQIVMYPSMFDEVPWKLYIAVVLLPALGLSIGYGLATICRLSLQARKTVAMECGIQNVPIALTIVSLSFEGKDKMDIAVFPSLYGFSMVTSASCASLVYNAYKKWWSKQEIQSDKTEDGEVVISLMPQEKQETLNSKEKRVLCRQSKPKGERTIMKSRKLEKTNFA